MTTVWEPKGTLDTWVFFKEAYHLGRKYVQFEEQQDKATSKCLGVENNDSIKEAQLLSKSVSY